MVLEAPIRQIIRQVRGRIRLFTDASLAWHARGQEFDSPMLHHLNVKKT
tara:strand:- start:3282 stop:3428 length:147 start_codon:yes stop_codon:yes gene_type:complete